MSLIAAGLPNMWPNNVEYISKNIYDAQLYNLTKLKDQPGNHIEGVEVRELDKTHVAFDTAAGMLQASHCNVVSLALLSHPSCHSSASRSVRYRSR